MSTWFPDFRPRYSLYVDLRTEFTRTDFNLIEVHLIESLRPSRRQETYVDFIGTPPGDLLNGVRLTEVHDLTRGTYKLVGRLLDHRGASIALKIVIVDIRASEVVSLKFAR